MGVSYTAYAGFGLRIDVDTFPSTEVERPSCNCANKGPGKFCSSCGREIMVHTYEEVDDKWDELTDFLEGLRLPKGWRFVNKGEYMAYAYIGWISKKSAYGGDMEESWTIDEVPSMADVRAKIEELLSDYPEIFIDDNYGFHAFTYVG